MRLSILILWSLFFVCACSTNESREDTAAVQLVNYQEALNQLKDSLATVEKNPKDLLYAIETENDSLKASIETQQTILITQVDSLKKLLSEIENQSIQQRVINDGSKPDPQPVIVVPQPVIVAPAPPQSPIVTPVPDVVVINDTLNNSLSNVDKAEEKQKIEGKVAFHCPNKMYHNQTYDAFGLIADVLSNETITGLIEEQIAAHAKSANEIEIKDKDLLIKKINFYDFVELQLANPNSENFEIIKVHSDDKQSYSETKPNWHWKITPKTTDRYQQMVLKVLAYDRENSAKLCETKTYHIDVVLESKKFLRNIKFSL